MWSTYWRGRYFLHKLWQQALEEICFMNDDVLRYVNKSSYRVKVLKSLGEDVKMPKEIASDSGILPNHISNVLRQLK